MEKTRKFTRDLPEVRRRQLIEATLQCLAEFGHAGTSVRAVCARAGVSPGLVTHHFEGIDDLIAAAYAHVGELVAAALDAAMAEAGGAFVIASLKLDFRAEITWPGEVTIATRIAKTGSSSIHVEQAIFQGDRCAATAETVIVHIDETTKRSRPLTDEAKARLARASKK